MTSQRRRFTHSDGITVLLSEKRRLLYKSLGIVEPASGEDLGSETRFQTPGDAILAKFHQNLNFLNPTLFEGVMRPDLGPTRDFSISYGSPRDSQGTSAGTQTVFTPKLVENEFMDPEKSSKT